MSATSTTPPPIFPTSILSSSTSVCRDWTISVDRDAGKQRLCRAVGGDGLCPSPPAIFRRDHGQSAVLARPGKAPVRQRLRHLVAQMADREIHGVRVAGGFETRIPRRSDLRNQA